MINKYEAYWIWEKNPNGTYKFRCISDEHPLRCCNCPFYNTVLCSSSIIKCVPTWNKVHKLMQEIYHESPVPTLFGKLLSTTTLNGEAGRNERRKCKDYAEVLRPLMGYLTSDKGETMFDLLREVFGKPRKAEDRQKNRTYTNRRLDEEVV